MDGLDPGGAAGFEEFSQALVLEATYHGEQCNPCRNSCQFAEKAAYNVRSNAQPNRSTAQV